MSEQQVLPITKLENFINGEWRASLSNDVMEIINPANGLVSANVPRSIKDDVNEVVEIAKNAYKSGVWSKMPLQQRLAIMKNFAMLIHQSAEELIYLEGISSGTTIRKLVGADILSVVGCIIDLVKMAEEEKFVENLPINIAVIAGSDEIVQEPIGVVAAITPWNMPLMLGIWKIAPALIMGNSVIVKPASQTPLGTLKLAEIAHKAGIPAGVFNVIAGPGGDIGDALVSHPDIGKITFTGSTEIGREILKKGADTIKRVSLELGGKSAAIVLSDADFDIMIPGLIYGSMFHSGQACTSGSRALVHSSIYDEVIELLKEEVKKIKVGDPMSQETGMGPVVSKQQYNSILSYIQSGIDEGARLVTGGKPANVPGFENGYYIEPTIFADVKNTMKIAQEEIFGPVLVVIKYDTVEEAIEIANDSIYGLAGGVWSRDIEEAQRIANLIESGTIWINNWHILRNDAPFGGYKQSGIGRELGRQIFKEYSETKYIHTSLIVENNLRFSGALMY